MDKRKARRKLRNLFQKLLKCAEAGHMDYRYAAPDKLSLDGLYSYYTCVIVSYCEPEASDFYSKILYSRYPGSSVPFSRSELTGGRGLQNPMRLSWIRQMAHNPPKI